MPAVLSDGESFKHRIGISTQPLKIVRVIDEAVNLPEARLQKITAAPEFSSTMEALMGVPNQQPLWGDYSIDVAKYNSIFAEWEPKKWDEMNAATNPWTHTYYDRGYGVYYGMYWRTGMQIYLDRGHFCVKEYRDNYVLPNNGGVAPRWANPEGLAVHYEITGDPLSLEALELMTSGIMSARVDDILTTSFRDGRIQGRAILCQLMAYLVTGNESYADKARQGVADMLTWFDGHNNGAWDSCAPTTSGVTCGQTSGAYCGGMASFQVCHAIIDCLARHHELVEPIPRLPEILQKTMDRTFDLFWQGDDPDLKQRGHAYIQPYQAWLDSNTLYVDSYSCGDGSTGPGTHLPLLELEAYGYAKKYTNLSRFKTYGDEVFAQGISGSVTFPTVDMNNSKVFNQSYYRSWRYPWLSTT